MGHYIGNARTLEIYAPNLRDDLVPDPGTNKVTFDLSQEVPGGYEGNVLVFRRKFLYNQLCEDNLTIAIDDVTNTLTTSDDILAAVLSSVVPGQSILLEGATDVANNALYRVETVDYNPGGTGSLITITFDNSVSINSAEGPGVALTLTQAYDGPWEALEPEVDYTIGGVGPQYNRLITLSEVLQEEDVCYVIHKGDATYNFVPTQNSVGPDQLSENLRNFKFDRFTGDGLETDFTLTQEAVSAKSLVVYVDGVVQEPNDAFFLTGDYTLNVDGITLEFAVAPANLSKIRVLHLGFSTISRRSVLSDGQIGIIGADTVDTTQLRNGAVTEPKLAINSVSTTKIQANAVTGAKILLDNNEFLRAKKFDTTPYGVLRLDVSDNLILYSPAITKLESTSTIILSVGGSDRVTLTSSVLGPNVTATIDLGTSLLKFKDGYFSGQLNAATGSLSGNLTVSGNIITPGTVDGVDVSNLNTQVQDIQSNLIPPGSIIAFGGAVAPTGYLLCDGSVYAQATYPALFTNIGSNYNTGGEGAGNFRVPDGRQKFPLGKATSGTGSVLGSYGGAIDHTHTTSNHTHDISHTHTVPGHYHLHDTAAGSSINIISSGTHNTDLAHGHSPSLSNPGEGVHSHSISVLDGIVANSGGSHFHHMIVDGLATVLDDTIDEPGIVRSYDGAGGIFAYDLKTSGLAPDRGRTSTGGVHSHTVSGTVLPKPESAHQHTVPINPVSPGTFSSSTGAHTHTTAQFAGSIGNVNSAVNGNNALSTITQSTPTSGSAGAGSTGLANPPFFVVNYIIKT